MAQPSFTSRGAFPGRLPDRTIPSSSQPQFGQSAPGFGRQVQYQPQPLPQQQYGAYSQFGAGTGYGAGRGQVQGLAGIIGGAVEKETNALNDLADEQKDEINEAFGLFDLDKDGHLDFHEFRVALRALGFDAEKEEIKVLITAHGIPKPGATRFEDTRDPRRGQKPWHASQLILPRNAFTSIAAQKIHDRNPAEEVERAFYLFDLDHKDYISLDDLRRVARELGETSLEEQELQTMIDEFDYDGTGGVSRDAFFGICMQ